MLYKIIYKIYNIFDDDQCDYILKFCEEHGVHGQGNKIANEEYTKDLIIRQSKIKWINSEKIYDLIKPAILECSHSSSWNVRLAKMEDLQFTRYDIGDKYDWHYDNSREVYPKNHPFEGLVRKISFTILLSDNFTGGEFEIECGHPGENQNRIESVSKLKKGSILIFPSFLPHRVKPVISGTRHSLVGWCCGPQWS